MVNEWLFLSVLHKIQMFVLSRSALLLKIRKLFSYANNENDQLCIWVGLSPPLLFLALIDWSLRNFKTLASHSSWTDWFESNMVTVWISDKSVSQNGVHTKLNKGDNLVIILNMSRVVRKPAFCICKNKDPDQLRGNCEADQRLCYRHMDSAILLLSKSEISSL